MAKTTHVVVPAKVLVAALALLGLGTAGGGVSAFRSLTPADVSKQIAIEAPIQAHDVSDQIGIECSYLEDRALVMHQLSEQSRKTNKLFEKVDAVEKAVTESIGVQGAIQRALVRIEKKLEP